MTMQSPKRFRDSLQYVDSPPVGRSGPQSCELDQCGVLAVGRCSFCGLCFCRTHQAIGIQTYTNCCSSCLWVDAPGRASKEEHARTLLEEQSQLQGASAALQSFLEQMRERDFPGTIEFYEDPTFDSMSRAERRRVIRAAHVDHAKGVFGVDWMDEGKLSKKHRRLKNKKGTKQVHAAIAVKRAESSAVIRGWVLGGRWPGLEHTSLVLLTDGQFRSCKDTDLRVLDPGTLGGLDRGYVVTTRIVIETIAAKYGVSLSL